MESSSPNDECKVWSTWTYVARLDWLAQAKERNEMEYWTTAECGPQHGRMAFGKVAGCPLRIATKMVRPFQGFCCDQA